jgi:hypothetical protein
MNQVLTQCPACGGTQHTLTIVAPTYYAWGCDNRKCMCEWGTHYDSAGEVLGTELIYLPGMDDDEDEDGVSKSIFALIHRLGDAVQAGDAQAMAALEAIPKKDRDNYCRIALLRAKALLAEADEMETWTQEDIDRSLEFVRQLKAAETPERREELMEEQAGYMRQKRERERQGMARELADRAAKRPV